MRGYLLATILGTGLIPYSQQEGGRVRENMVPLLSGPFLRGPQTTVLSSHWTELTHITKPGFLIGHGSLYMFSG